jgi:hypothetical protein
VGAERDRPEKKLCATAIGDATGLKAGEKKINTGLAEAEELDLLCSS